MNVFISVPSISYLNYVEGENLKETRERNYNEVVSFLRKMFSDDFVFLNSTLPEIEEDIEGDVDIKILALSKEIELLSMADIIVMINPDWDKYENCRIHHEIAKNHSIMILEMWENGSRI